MTLNHPYGFALSKHENDIFSSISMVFNKKIRKGINQKRHKSIPIPRWVFILAYLAVPVKFLFSLQKIRRKSNLQKIMKVQNDNLEQQKSSSILIFTRIIRKTMQIDDIEIKIKTNYKSLQRNYPNNSCK